ncbi:MAG: glycosyltransferase [Halobacteriota archaeon]|jgi:glycosyltransferase involved in cell wall biosynthesis
MTTRTSNASSENAGNAPHQVTQRVRYSDAISVVIPTKNRPHDVLKAISSVENQSSRPAEIVIVDASDEDGLEALVNNNSSGEIRIEYIRSVAGLTHQKNIGIQKSSGDIVLVLDDDIILKEDYVKEILNVFNNTDFNRIGCVYGNQIPPNEGKNNVRKKGSFAYSITVALKTRINTLIRTLFFLQKPSTTGKFRLSGYSTYPAPSNPGANVSETEGAPGGYTAYSREVWDEFRFDENLKGYSWGEDDDFSVRVSRKYKNIFNPKAKVIHHSKSSKGANYAYSKMRIENHHYLFEKNFPHALRNRFAYNMSVLGTFLFELENAIVHRNSEGVKGFLDGLRVVHKKTIRGGA